MSNPETLVIIGLTFLIAGLVKGVIGMGLPMVSLSLLTATVGLLPAMGLLIVPSLVTNVWQGLAGGALVSILRRFWTFLLAVCAGTWVGVGVLANTDVALLSALLGILLCIYSVMNLMRPQVASPGRSEPWLSPVMGAASGVLTGLTGTFVFPGIPYLQALSLPRDVLIQTMGVVFTVSTAALAVSLSDHRLLSVELGTLSVVALLPALVGMALGQKVRRLLSEDVFRKAFFVSLLILGVYIFARAVS